MTEIWGAVVNNSMPDIRHQATEIEAAGYDGAYMSDSQNIRMECWVALTVAALSTTRIKIGPYVTNPLTRHVAVTAGAAATLQEVSGGRVVLAVGRGDSALANIGYGPAPVKRFEAFVSRLQAYLGGTGVDFDPDEFEGVPKSRDLGYQVVPEQSRIVWLPTDLPKVPVSVVASGRRVLAAGARLADEVTLVVGGDIDTLRTGMEYLRMVRSEASLDPDALKISAFLPVVVDPNRERALQRVSHQVGEVGRWMTVQNGQSADLDQASRDSFRESAAKYHMTNHGPANSLATPAITNTLPTAVLDKHGIAGPADDVADRLRALLDLGLERIIVAHNATFATQVLPTLR
jgi:5,10-methylenetetrahydromethanopterin reductase